MKFDFKSTDEIILSEIGTRLAQVRLTKNLTQAQLAIEAGISKRTVERLESGEVATRLSAFIRVCRVLGLLEQLDHLVGETAPSPIAQLKSRGRQRRRASGGPARPAADGVAAPPQAPWTWGEQS
ncbi:MAG: helix-turn-helix transcriptional regulator [Lacunisphaera sp.]|nr:helix-turn-helix transcriptional regulator [Lacunisphaera sp.]